MNQLPSFKVSRFESLIIDKIVARAAKELEIGDRLSLNMDITACHANGNALDLNQLLESDKADFGHDVHGIQRYIDRRTGKLTDFFCPRCSLPESPA